MEMEIMASLTCVGVHDGGESNRSCVSMAAFRKMKAAFLEISTNLRFAGVPIQ